MSSVHPANTAPLGRDALTKLPEEAKATHCNDCGACESACPNDLEVRKVLEELVELTA
ncbi:MAG: 4Fe-4S dicluster domain-containing protein [Planctomycetota bacterium]|jgi:predicted aldo/keto reductase-like oxidoreductase